MRQPRRAGTTAVKAMILAAGRGERMRPLTHNTPKPLLKAGGRSLIEWLIEGLVRAGIRELVVNHAAHGARLREALGDGARFGARIEYSDEGDEPLETAGGIRQALPLLGTQPFLVVNGDIWTEFPFETLPEQPDGLAHLVLVPNPAHHPEGDFALAEGRVRLMGEPRWTFSGIGVYRRELFEHCPGGPLALAPVLRQAIAADQVSGECYRGAWYDIGTPQRLEALDRALSGR